MVNVVDTQDPAFVSIEVAPGSLWPADGRLHLFRLGQEIRSEVADTCDPSPAVSIVDMSGSGDFAFDEGVICIRAAASGAANPLRNYTVTVEALDASGNWAEEDVVITNADFAPAVADDDPRCP